MKRGYRRKICFEMMVETGLEHGNEPIVVEAHTKIGEKCKWYEPLCDEAHTKTGNECKKYAS